MAQHQVEKYDGVSRLFHWLSAITVLAMFALGVWMVELDYYSQWYQKAPFVHKSVGLLLAAVTIGRLLWRLKAEHPEVEGKPVEVMAARTAHSMMYVLLFVLFVSGYLISTSDGRGIEVFGWFTVPGAGELFRDQSDIAGRVHYYAAFLLIGLVVVHVAAALKHHFFDKDNTLRKMIGISK